MTDRQKQSNISHHASWLAYHAGQLRACIGGANPNDYHGWKREIEGAEADIEEIRRRAERHERKIVEVAAE